MSKTAIALLLLLGQTNAGEAEVTQGVFDLLALGLAQPWVFITGRQLLKGLIQTLVLTDEGLVFGEQRQTAIVRLAQLGGVEHRIQVRHR